MIPVAAPVRGTVPRPLRETSGKRRPPNAAEQHRRTAFGKEWGSFMHRTSQLLRKETAK